jgi:hypothetical protein
MNAVGLAVDAALELVLAAAGVELDGVLVLEELPQPASASTAMVKAASGDLGTGRFS